MPTLEFRFAIFLTIVLCAFGLLHVKGDIAPDIVLVSNSDGKSMYDDPMEYQRTKRSYIHEDDNEDYNDDDDIGDEGFDENEDEDDRGDSLAKNLNYPGSSVLHKKDVIHQMNIKAAEQQQPLKTEEDGESTDDSGSSNDDEGSSSGSGSGEAREERAYARHHVSDKEDDTHEDASVDEEETSGSGDLDPQVKKHIAEENTNGGAPRARPRNLIKMVLEESKDAEREEKLESENDEENSGQESGSSASFVRGSGEIGVYHEEEQPVPKPLPKNVPQVRNSTSGKDIANKSESLHKETHLHSNDQVGEVDDHPKKKSSTGKSKSKVEMNSQDLKTMAHKEKSPNKEKPKEDEESSENKIEHSSHVQDAKIHKKHKKKAHNRVSKVSHLAKKRLHHKHLTAHVTHPHVVENHFKVVNKMPVIKASSQMCHSDQILAGHSLKGGTRAGHFQTLGETASMHACLQRCCSKHPCDVALLIDGRCYGVACFSKELCEAIPVPHPHFVFSQLGFISKGQKRGDIEKNQEFHCRYGNLTLRNNEQWSGELCGGVVRCKDGITTVKKCPGIPPKPDDCAKPRLIIKHRSGKCCHMKWKCKARHCIFNNRVIKHGYKLSDPLCTGVVSCYNGHLNMEYCPKIPEKPKDCARPKLMTINVPGKCCKKLWVCSDKSCAYDGLKLSHGEKLTDASCAVVMECRNGFLRNKQCPGPPPVPHTCINPLLRVKRVPGECCEMNWTCEMS